MLDKTATRATWKARKRSSAQWPAKDLHTTPSKDLASSFRARCQPKAAATDSPAVDPAKAEKHHDAVALAREVQRMQDFNRQQDAQQAKQLLTAAEQGCALIREASDAVRP